MPLFSINHLCSVPTLISATLLLLTGLLNAPSTLAASVGSGGDYSLSRDASQPSGADDSASRRVIGSSINVPLGLNPDQEVAANLNQLRRLAAASDKIRVIVGVRAAFAPEGFQDQSTRQRQRQEIGAVQSTIEKALPRRDAARIQRLTAVPFMALEVDADQLEALAAMPEVTDIQEDRQAWASLAHSVPLIQADDAWSAGYVGKGWAVAVLDNGVQTSHPFLQGTVVAEACYSTHNPGAGEYSMCPGRVTASTASGSASYCYDDTYGNWACDHGTHVAGIAAGRGGNQTFAGVAKGGNLIPMQVFTWDAYYRDSFAYFSDINRGLQRVIDLHDVGVKIAAVNMSLGGGAYTSESSCNSANASTKALIDNLKSRGIATIIASGNEGKTNAISAPACISSAVSVGATWDTSGWTCSGSSSAVDKVACYSNTATFLDLLAPGSAIDASVPTNTYATYHGTSMATPHAAGCWALLKAAKPEATVDAIEAALKSTGKLISDYRVTSILKPRIDCHAALNQLLAVAPPPPVTQTFQFKAATATVTEGTTTLTIPVTRSSGSGSASVKYATSNGSAVAGKDYTAKSGTLSFAAGVTTQNISIRITNDTLYELDETFAVALNSPSSGWSLGSPAAATVTIKDNGDKNLAFASATAQVNEGGGTVTLWVQRLGSASASASIRYATSNGTARSGSDYVSKSGTLSWAAGDANPKAITISIVNNTTKEATEAFYVTLSSPKGATLGAISRATVSVTDND